MSEIRKLLESLDSINEATLVSTVANGESFIKDVGKAFGGQKGKTLAITATLRGTNVIEYSIREDNVGVEESVSSDDASPAKMNAFKSLGLDEHQWEAFSLTWDYCKKHFNPENVARRQEMKNITNTRPTH